MGRKISRSGAQYGIAVYCPVDGAGDFITPRRAEARLPEELIGKTVWQANPIVNDFLSHHGALLATRKFEHSYPHCWRCHNPTIFRATEQWFIGMDRNDLRGRTLEAIKNVKWTPASGEAAHVQHDRHAARLVHFAPAHLGRADHGVLLRRRARSRLPIAKFWITWCDLFREYIRRCLV